MGHYAAIYQSIIVHHRDAALQTIVISGLCTSLDPLNDDSIREQMITCLVTQDDTSLDRNDLRVVEFVWSAMGPITEGV